MAPGRKHPQPQPQQQGVVVAAEPSVARRMWRVLRAVLYMLRRGLPSGRKLAMDLHLLLHRGKIAGKALGDLLTFHHHHHHHHHHHRDAGFSSSYAAAGASAGAAGARSSFLCRLLDPGAAVHEPARGRREVQFSCSDTPSAAHFGGLGLLGKRGRRNRRRDEGYLRYHNYDAADVARVFEMLNDDGLFSDEQYPAAAATPTPTTHETPSPARLMWTLARSPAAGSSRQLRVADSPAPPRDGGDDVGAQVDRRADEFIRRFYEQLRAQRSAASTPDCYGYNASPYVSSTGSRRTPRAIAAGIA